MSRSTVRISAYIVISLLCLITATARAEEAKSDTAQSKVKISGQVRFRWFLEDVYPERETRSENYGDLRTRVCLRALIDSRTNATVEFQDGRIMGEVVNGNNTSGGLNSANAVDLHQAYITVDQLFAKPIRLMAGRFEFAIGNERLYGRSEWDLIGRAFDGVILSQSILSATLDEMVLKIRDNRTENGQSIYGLRAIIPRPYLEPFIMYDNDRNPELDTVNRDFDDHYHRVSAGIFHKGTFRMTDWHVQYIYQFGDQYYGLRDSHIDASLVTAEVALNGLWKIPMRLAIGLDWSTGSTDGTVSTARWIEDPYKSNALSRGEFQLFNGTQYHGLSDVYVRFTSQISSSGTISSGFHFFETTAARFTRIEDAVTDKLPGFMQLRWIGPSKRMGCEFDLSGEWRYLPHTGFAIAGSLFFPSEYYEMPYWLDGFPNGTVDPSPIYRLYTTLTVNF